MDQEQMRRRLEVAAADHRQIVFLLTILVPQKTGTVPVAKANRATTRHGLLATPAQG